MVPLLTSAGHYADVVLPEALARNRRYASVRLRSHAAGRARIRGSRRWWRGGSASCCGSTARAGRRRRCCSRGTAPGAIRRAARPPSSSRRRSAAAGGGRGARRVPRRRPAAGRCAGARPLGRRVIVIPFLIGGGSHAAEDIPRAIGLEPGELPTGGPPTPRWIVVDQAVGTLPGLVDIIIDLARRASASAPRVSARRGAAPGRAARGTVHLVGGGPGDPGLITARGLELLRRADVVVHDRLIGPELLDEARPGAVLIDVGKGPRARAALTGGDQPAAGGARAGRAARWCGSKGGDPFVFGRGSEELEACRAAGVACEVVPGVSSAIAAPAAAGIPVTARGVARSFAVVTAHQAGDFLRDRPSSARRGGHDRGADGPLGPADVHRRPDRGGTRSLHARGVHPVGHHSGAAGHPRHARAPSRRRPSATAWRRRW